MWISRQLSEGDKGKLTYELTTKNVKPRHLSEGKGMGHSNAVRLIDYLSLSARDDAGIYLMGHSNGVRLI
jgi:hypothetical protein